MNTDEWSDQDRQTLASHLQWNSYRSERHRLLYVSTPKVACSTLKWWFASLEGYAHALEASTVSSESDPELVVHDVFHKVAPHVTGLPLEQLTEALSSPAYFRFALVRNPFKRVFSAWQSKILLREPLQIVHYRDQDFIDHPIESAQDIAAAFEAFVEHLAAKEAPHYWDHHWTPQSSILRPDLIDYSMISKIEEPQEISEALVRWLGAGAPDPFSTRRANESIIPYLSQMLTPRSVNLIRELYERDFEVFGYDEKVPNSRDSFSSEQWDVALKAVKLVRARHKMLGQRNGEITRLRSNLAQHIEEIADLGRLLKARDTHISSLDTAIDVQQAEISRLSAAEAELGRILNSRAWRLTWLLRKMNEIIRRRSSGKTA